MNFEDLLIKDNFEDRLQFEDDDEDDEEVSESHYEEESHQELTVINEAEEESSQSLRQFPQSVVPSYQPMTTAQQIGYLISDTYDVPVMLIDDPIDKKNAIQLQTFKEQMKKREEDKRLLEQKFQRLLREQANLLLKQKKEADIKQKLAKTIKPEKVDEAVKIVLKEQEIKHQPTPPITKSQTNYKKQLLNEKREAQIQKLHEEIDQLKKQHNEDEEIIKTLKVQMKKMQDLNSTNNSSFISRGSTKSKPDALQVENERLQQEVMQLKKTINDERATYKQQLSRLHKVHSALNTQKQKQQPEQEQEPTEYQKEKIQLNQQIADLRTKITQLNDIIEKQNDLMKKKDKDIAALLTKIDNIRKENKSEAIIQDLEEKLKEKQIELAETKEEMMIDNQIKLLFPTYGNMVVQLMNLMMKFEINPKKGQKWIYQIIKAMYITGYNLVTSFFQRTYEYFDYFMTKNPMKHPSNQELVREAMTKIRANPTALESMVKNQRETITQQQQLIESQRKQIEEMKEMQRDSIQRNSTIEELHKVDKIELANNLMMRIMKQEVVQPDVQIPEFIILKKYMKLVYKSLHDQKKSSQEKSRSKSPKQKQQQPLQPTVRVETIRPSSCSKKSRHDKRDADETDNNKKKQPVKKLS